MISLSDLADIWMPAPVGLWPISSIAWILLAIVLALLGYWGWRYQGYQKTNRYRHQALHELRQAQSNAQLASILKRTALVAYPRQQVARLSSERWCDWLSQQLTMPDSARAALNNAFYQPDHSPLSPALVEYCIRWVKRHQGEHSC